MDESDEPIAFRRVFVPADQADAWPLEGEKFIPIDAREFRQLISATNRDRDAPFARVSITEAVYSGRLQKNGIIAGRGTWRIELRDEAPAFLPLGDSSLTIREPRWQGEFQRPARLGFWGRRGGTPDTFGLEVVESSVLEFSWQAKRDVTNVRGERAWRLPPAASSHLKLELPPTHQPLIEGGVVLESLPFQENTSASEEIRNWEIILGGSSESSLRIAAASDSTESASDIRLRDETSYRIDERGVNVVASLRCEGRVSQLRELVVPLPEGVQFISAMAEGNELDWKAFAHAGSSSRAVIIELPASISADPLTVTLQAWHALPTTGPWRLPRLWPEGLFWTSGTLELSVAPMIELQQLVPNDCLQTGVVQSADDGRGAETHWFTAYTPDAGLDVTVAHRAPEVTARLGSSISISESTIDGRLTTQLQVARGSLHKLTGELAPGWIVEAVETIPADALGEWFINRRDGANEIEIRFVAAANSNRAVTVRVDARMEPASFAKPISANSLRMIGWHDAEVAEHLVGVHTVEPYAVEPIGDLPPATPKQPRRGYPAGADSPVDADVSEAAMFDVTNADGSAALRITLERGEFEADIAASASLLGAQVRMDYVLAVRPVESRVDRVLVFSNALLGEDLRWTDRETGTTLAAERLAADDPRLAGFPDGGAMWSVRLPQPAASPVAIIASVTRKLSGRQELPLLSLPRAVTQRGRVHLACDSARLPLLEQLRLEPIPTPLDDDDEPRDSAAPSVLAAYRYNPTECSDASRCPRFWIAQQQTKAAEPLVARRADLSSYMSADGRVVHQAVYLIEESDEADLRLPVAAKNVMALLNNRRLEVTQTSSAPSGNLLRVPRHEKPATLQIQFETHQVPLAAAAQLLPPHVEGLVILTGAWIVWLPAEFEGTGNSRWQVGEGDNWRRRLFGPLARPHGSRPFDPPSNEALLPSTSGQSNTPSTSPLPSDLSLAATLSSPMEFNHGPPADLDGWRSYRTAFVGHPTAPFVVARPSTISAGAVAVFLMCFVAGRAIAGWHRVVYVVLVAVGAAAALMLPSIYAPLATGAFLGLLLSLVAVRPHSAGNEDSPTKTWNQVVTAGTMSLALIAAFTPSAIGQPSTNLPPNEVRGSRQSSKLDSAANDKPAAATSKVHRVLIPTDENRQVVEGTYYVDEELLRRLFELANNKNAAHDWLIADMACDAELVESEKPHELVAGQWTVFFDIEVLARDTTITLPLRRNEANWHEAAMLDGLPVAIEWQPDGRRCALVISEPGRYRLAISFLPQIQQTADQNEIEMTIPELPGGRFQLHSSSEIAGIDVSGVHGAHVDDSTNSLSGELDGSGRIAVRWPQRPVSRIEGPRLRITEMQWLHVSLDEAVLTAKIIVEGGVRRPDSLSVAIEGPWRLIAADNLISSEASGALRQTVHVALPPDDIDRQEIQLRWQLDEVRPVGVLRWPAIELTALPVAQRWIGVSSDPALACELSGARGATLSTAEEFQARWGGELGSENLAAVLTNAEFDPATVVSIRPRPAQSTIDEVLHVAAGDEGLRLLYEAQVTPSASAEEFQTMLLVSDGIEIDEVALMAGRYEVPIRWSRAANGSATIFFSEPMSNTYRLTISGRVQCEPSGTYRVPQITIDPAAAAQRVEFYRDDQSLLEVRGVRQTDQRVDRATKLPATSWGDRFAGAYLLSSPSFAAGRLLVSPNDVHVSGQTLTAVERDSEAWWATFVCRFVVEQGELGGFDLSAPATWSGPLELQSNVPATVETSATGGQPSLTIRFTDPVGQGKEVEFRVRGRLALVETTQVAVPEIVMQTPFRGPHYVLIPSSVDSQPTVWTQRGVRPTELPPMLTQADAGATRGKAFEIISRPIRMILRPPSTESAAATVRLADTFVTTGPFGGHLTIAHMLVVPRGLTECVIELPPNQKLVRVWSEGRPAFTQRLDDRRYVVPLGTSNLPQLFEIVARSSERVPPLDGPVEFARPVLSHNGKPIPVEVSLWSVGLPPGSSRPDVLGAAVVSSAEQAALRLDRVTGVVESATRNAIELPLQDGKNWYVPWAKRLAVIRQQSLGTTRSSDSDGLLQVGTAAEEQLADAAERLETWIQQCNQIWEVDDTDPPRARASFADQSIWALARSSAAEWIDCVAEGDATRLVVDASSPISPTQARLGGLLAIVAMAAGTIAVMRWPTVRDLACRWPHAIAFVAGLAYWAFLWPSVLGLFIAAGSAWLAVRPGWPGRAERAEASTVMRAPRSNLR